MLSLLRAPAVGAFLLAALPVAAADYDLVADWNPGTNPNGAWAYQSGSVPMPYWSSIVALAGSGGYAPSAAGGHFLPVFWQSAGSGSDILVHSHDGFNGFSATGEATLTWTSPIDGTIDLSGYFYYAQSSLLRSNEVSVTLAGTPLASATVSYLQHQDYANRYTFSFNDLTVAAADKLSITFIRSPGFAPGTVTALDIHIVAQPVPEPATVAQMLGGLAVLAWLARRRSA